MTRLASHLCETPIALISLVDKDRQWFKSRVGTDSVEDPRDASFCAHALGGTEMLIVPDALEDHRFAANPLVTGDPFIRFYAGAPITGPEGHNLGTLCVIDRQPREISEANLTALRVLARQASTLIHLRQNMLDLQAAAERQTEIEQKLRQSEDQLREANQRLEQMVRTDALTGLGNRRLFEERLRQEWKLSERLGLVLSLLMIDVDHFKDINDASGHAAGDSVLRNLGELLVSFTRESDTCVRYGGEEFAVILPATSPANSEMIANRLCRLISETPFNDLTVTVSIGVASSLSDGNPINAKTLVQRADAALYEAKSAGRNRVAVSPPTGDSLSPDQYKVV